MKGVRSKPCFAVAGVVTARRRLTPARLHSRSSQTSAIFGTLPSVTNNHGGPTAGVHRGQGTNGLNGWLLYSQDIDTTPANSNKKTTRTDHHARFPTNVPEPKCVCPERSETFSDCDRSRNHSSLTLIAHTHHSPLYSPQPTTGRGVVWDPC